MATSNDTQMTGVMIDITTNSDGTFTMNKTALAVKNLADETEKAEKKTFKFSDIWKRLNSDLTKKKDGQFNGIRASVIALEAGLRLAERALGAFTGTIGSAVSASLNFREANDPVVKELEGFGRLMETTWARIGDMLTPIMIGLSRSFTPILQGLKDWATGQDKVKRSEIASYVVSLASLMVNVMATALTVVNKLWGKLDAAMGWVEARQHRINAQALKDRKAEMMEKQGRLLKSVADGLDEQIAREEKLAELASHRAENNEKEVQDWIDGNQQKVADALKAGEQIAGSIAPEAGGDLTRAEREKIARDKEAAARKAKAEAERLEREAQQRFVRETNDLKESHMTKLKMTQKYLEQENELNEQKDKSQSARSDGIIDNSGKGLTELRRGWAEFYAMRQQAAVKTAPHIKKAEEKLTDSLMQQSQAVSGQIMGIINVAKQGFDAFIEYLGQKILEFLLQSFVMMFLNFVTGGGASIGSMLGGAAKSTFGIGMASGGFVPNTGMPGRDSVPAMLTPEEFVIPAPIVKDIKNGRKPSRPGHYNDGGTVSAPTGGRRGSDGGGPTFMLFGTSRAQFNRAYRDNFKPATERLKRNRVLKG